MEVGITKLRKGSKGSVILGCESEGKMEKLKDTVRENLHEYAKSYGAQRQNSRLHEVNESGNRGAIGDQTRPGNRR
ncbi:hypothetical protein P5V15_011362 [Pogonomyrmex californicus]